MQFLHLYNQSPFKQKRVVWVTSLDKNAEDVLNEEKGRRDLYDIKEYEDNLKNRKDAALTSMQNRARSVTSRLQETLRHPTAKGAIRQIVDEKVKDSLRVKYAGKITVAEEAQQGRLSRIFGISIKKYETITERVNVCNGIISQVEGEIQRGEEMQRLYEQGMDYLRRGIRGKLRYPLKKRITDPVSYKANRKVLENVRQIQAEARGKKSEYESRIREKFGDVQRFEDSIRQLISLYEPGLAANVDKMLEDNAFSRNDDLEKAINRLHDLSRPEKAALLAMAKEQRGKKSRYSKAFEKVGKEVETITEPAKMAEALSALKIGEKFDMRRDLVHEQTFVIQKTEVRNGKSIIVGLNPLNPKSPIRIAFNLSDKTYTENVGVGAGTRFETHSFSDIKHIKITTK
ncbi:MAG: hypothetical protein UT33_C0009G0070 [Candidatus Peregrinibacteria bacterium GW2011_GWC2_39_14]|nr:MAG: hypothetical protein US92_C0005G0070 [Candidatus Peregrinibacteria bacterium GW2011_GWA2_38_36]KKR06619.1 MAG: hypothetical protein UT33_C0009G0070 [Candidatus Peregrinibacteria bacterium GW2011_GWC2_39_14]